MPMTMKGKMLWKFDVFREKKKAKAYPDVTPRNTHIIPTMAVKDLK
jgi:hypothetical protein